MGLKKDHYIGTVYWNWCFKF